jgi:hypothetical protein
MLWELKKCWYRTYQTVFKLAMNFMDGPNLSCLRATAPF